MYYPRFYQQEPDVYTQLEHNWQEIDLQVLKIHTPAEFRYVPQKGIDSYVGLITNGTESIHFDYGRYSNELKDAKFQRSYDTINGREAIVAFSDHSEYGIHFPAFRPEHKLTLFGKNFEKDLIFKIFRSVHAGERKMGFSSKPIGENVLYGFSPGEQLLNKNCSVCHGIEDVVVGPALKNISDRISREWIDGWIKNPDALIKTNKEAEALFLSYYKLQHPSYPFTDEAITILRAFIEQN